VIGKIDLVGGEGCAELRRRHPGASLVSAVSGEGIVALTERIEQEFARRLVATELLIPFHEGARLAELHSIAGDLIREDTSEGVRVSVRLPAAVAQRFARFAISEPAPEQLPEPAPAQLLEPLPEARVA
jgi:GTP-binding protein HflX